jgi:hypothetical protein
LEQLLAEIEQDTDSAPGSFPGERCPENIE